ncbi:MAG TPA: methionyl-tRNA formyltransferase [Candidatus Woesebacteria bacterium]|nr:methionyl-tRNA formyltransferase [Candidatus Woesebacteria bacterium]
MNIAYFGSPHISSLLLQELLKEDNQDYEISLVVSQPDKPVGKRLQIRPTKVAELAQAYQLPIFRKELKTHEEELISLIQHNNIELCIIFAYGEIISTKLLNTPQFGFWNIHPSLLPLYRGPSPVAYSLLLGDTQTGVSLMQLEPAMDTGPIIGQIKTSIALHENRNQLEERLTLIGSTLLKNNLEKLIINNKIDSKPQNHTLATHTYLLKKNDGYVNPLFLQKAITDEPVASELLPPILNRYIERFTTTSVLQQSTSKIFYNFYRALTPWPGIWTIIQTKKGSKRLKITDVDYTENLQIKQVQLEGKNPVDFETFQNAYRLI